MKRKVGIFAFCSAVVLIAGALFWINNAQMPRPEDTTVIQTAGGTIGPQGQTLEALLDKGADPDARDWKRETGLQPLKPVNPNPLATALVWWRFRNTGMYDYDTALIVAISSGPIQSVETLLSHGAMVNAKGMFGYTALHHAALQGNLAKAKLLIAAGADVNIRSGAGETALNLAQKRKKSAMVTLLKAAGAKN